ncbi:SusC/RagA family TonB-linked outer membrane protein [Parapedobacter lycopersici]|uniref:SusC/RagA family TonB-linked outer membrane protein n=1 Tax=Parapedobacter lycopersici TaxID=1864939 RepID=UPI00214D9E2F|nr:SusC/RagA family TonB-linked outer membrane protein [Parapedobacter lycopersici]
MKITFFMLLVLVTAVHAEGIAQKVTLSLKNEKIERLFSEITKQTAIEFLYSDELIEKAQPVSIEVKNAEVSDVLRRIMDKQHMTYKIIESTVIVNLLPNGPLLKKKLEPLPAIQDVRITGSVVDADGRPLQGASVNVKGNASAGTLTDAEGLFSLTVPSTNVTLHISYVGYQSREIALTGNTKINVVLEMEDAELGEVVVTALGISRERKSLSYSVTQLGGEDLNQAREINLGNALTGRIAGVNATSTASGPAGSSRVLIRGNGSLSGDNQPLYVVNGVPINNANQGSAGTYGGRDMGDGLLSINPDDIESMSILKGGTAAALYGSRAANGVILITTKSGKAQEGLGVEFNSSYTMEEPLTFANWQYEYGSGTRGQKPATQGEAVANGRTSWGGRLDGSMVVQPDGVERPYLPQKNNIKNFYNTGTTFTNTLALIGGSEQANFRFSMSDMNNDGIVPNSAINRKTFNLNANANLGGKIFFEGNAQYNIEEAKNRTFIADFTNNPNASVGLVGTNIDVRTLAPGYDENGYETPWNDYAYVVNPYFAVNKIKNGDERRRFIGSFTTRYNFTDFLYARARVGIDYFNIEDYNITPTGILYRESGQMTEGKNTTYETNAELLLGFERTFGAFSVNAIFGGNQMYNNLSSVDLSSGPFSVPFQYFISNGASQTFSKSFSEFAINSLFASADIGFNNYLYLTLTGRRDWFSTLSPESNSLFYPSVGLSFLLSDAWSTRPSWLNFAKVRTSWAQVGGGAPDPYGLNLRYVANSVTHFGQQLMSISGNTIPNALQPYTSTTAEAGIETWMFNNRIGLDVTLYDRTTTNDIVSASVARASGYTNVRLNIGKIQNRGVELLLTGRPFQSPEGFNWNISYNMAYNKNTVVKIADGLTSLVGARPRTQNAYIYHYEGMPYGMVSGFKPKQDENGNFVYNKDTGLPIQSELMSLGRGVPPLTMGISNDFSFKNFSLGFLIDGKFGSKMYVSTDAYGTFYGLHKQTAENGVRESGVTLDGVDQNGDPYHHTITAQEYYQGVAFSITDFFVSDASFVKLRQITFGYSLPQSLLARTPIKAASLSLVARNLLLLYSAMDNVDPESNYSSAGDSQGLENQGVPPVRSFGLDLKVRF